MLYLISHCSPNVLEPATPSRGRVPHGRVVCSLVALPITVSDAVERARDISTRSHLRCSATAQGDNGDGLRVRAIRAAALGNLRHPASSTQV